MPARKTNRQGTGGQRYHRNRLGCMLVPHGRVSGLLFTVNPRQESKALRELQLYLHPLIADLEEAHKRVEEHVDDRGRCDNATTEKQSSSKMSTDAEGKITPSTSSLLAAELAEYITTRGGQRRHEMRRIPMKEEKSDVSDDEDEKRVRIIIIIITIVIFFLIAAAMMAVTTRMRGGNLLHGSANGTKRKDPNEVLLTAFGGWRRSKRVAKDT
ncbi:hypothetical protein TcCL_NonESM09350 [Trypanosoma cruzi]|nr:hypothetical protein TcCL_NonESM09350 [Trypanosoma cruzi]